MSMQALPPRGPSAWQQAEQEFACDHVGRVRLTEFVASNGVSHYRNQCTRCGEAVGNFVKKSDIPAARLAALPAFDEALREGRQQAIRARADEIAPQVRYERRAGWKDWYEDGYLQSPEWHRKRDKVLARASGRCEGCGEQRATQVHHLTYIHVGREFLFELVAVCRDCHKRIHAAQEEPE